MSKTRRVNHRRGSRGTRKADRHLTVTSERRNPPDLRKLSRAVIALAMADMASEVPMGSETAAGHAPLSTSNAGKSEEGRS